MKLTTLKSLFMDTNPDGTLEFLGGGAYLVSFGQKCYRYRSDSHYALAERLGLIPEFNVTTESRRIVRELEEGAESSQAYSGCSDTARILWELSHDDTTIYCKFDGTDQFGRQMSRYFIAPIDTSW